MDVCLPGTMGKMNEARILTLIHTDTIIIDEVSMVRCDIIDAIDYTMRKTLRTSLPFGGKQVVFVGDLFQLPPVVKEGSADAEMLHDLYGAGLPFFYKAFALKRMNLPKIEFQKVYRQSDEDFLDILNKMRNGEVTNEDLALLNKHVSKNSDNEDYSVTLTSFNSMAEKINDEKLVFDTGSLIDDKYLLLQRGKKDYCLVCVN